ncbi:MAG: ribonuclease J [Alphaproteobacteria bacterium]
MINKFNKKGLYFFALGGAQEIGMNFFAYVVDGKIIIVDCGYEFLHDYPGIDLGLADFGFLEQYKEDILGIFITHGHEDHFGGIGYVLPKLGMPPVYGTNFTIGLIKERLKDFNIDDAQLNCEKVVNLEGFDVSFINMVHSVPETSALFIKTPYGNVFHATDWRLDDDNTSLQKTDYAAINKACQDGVDLFVCDSTNILKSEEDITESDVRKNLIELIPTLKNGIVATCFASNLTRVESLILASHQAGRTPVLMGRALVQNISIAKQCGYFSDLPSFSKFKEAEDISPENAVYITTGSQGNYRSSLRNVVYGENKNLKLSSGDNVVFSSKVIPGNEVRIEDLQEKLIADGVNVITTDDFPIHTSGHGGKEEIKKVYDMLKPKILVPVHGDKRFIREHKRFALECGIQDVLNLNDGDVLFIEKDEAPKIVETLPTSVFAVDRGRLVPIDAQVLKYRKQIAFNGSVFISFAVDKNWNPLGVKISSKDILNEDDFAELRDAIEQEVMALLPQKVVEFDKNEGRLIDFVRVYIRKRILKETGMYPVPFIHLYKL